MPCPELPELEAYASGSASDEESRALREHVSECADCRALLDEVSDNLEVESRARALRRRLDAPDESAPESIAGFRILHELGRGGMGVVYLAEQDHPRRQVALKVLRPGAASPALLRRFEHEANLLGRLQHPGIAQIHEAGVDGTRPYLAMEHVHGRRLDEHVQAHALDSRQRLRLLARICDAVHHAHVHGVIHRDLKPGNILVVEDEQSPGAEAGTPKILDFGVARATESDLQTMSRQTEVGQLLGTLPFMSPEQVEGNPTELDVRTDVYSLGVIAHVLLAGDLPYALRDRSVPEAARIIRDESPTALSRIDARFRGDVETIVSKALEKDPERRYQSASELAADIRRFLADEPIVARPPSAGYQLRKFARRNRTLVAAAAVLLIVLVGATAVSSWLALRATRAEQAARAQLERAETEAAKQQAVSDFLQGMLSSANPYLEGNRDVTVLQALDAAARELDEGRFADQPDVEVTVRSTIGGSYWASAEYDKAELQFRVAIDRLAADRPEDADSRATGLGALGMLFAEQNRYAEAESTFREQFELARRELGEGHLRTGSALSNLAGVMGDQGRLAEAESVLVLALEVSGRLTGEDRRVHVANLHSLGGLRHFRGHSEGAESAFREALELARQVHGPNHPAVISELEALSAVLAHRKDPGEIDLAREVLSRCRETFGRVHPQVARALANLGMSLFRHDHMEEAEGLLRESVAMHRAQRGDEHRDTARSLNDLGRVLDAQGRHGEAAALYEESVAIQERVLGDHPSLATTLNNLGRLHGALERYAEAERYFLRALQIRREKLGEEHAATATTAKDLMQLYEKWGKPERAAVQGLPYDP